MILSYLNRCSLENNFIGKENDQATHASTREQNVENDAMERKGPDRLTRSLSLFWTLRAIPPIRV